MITLFQIGRINFTPIMLNKGILILAWATSTCIIVLITLSLLILQSFTKNIRGIFHKVDELLYSIAPISPQILCLTEHHLREDELKTMKFTPYTLGAHFCRQSHKNGGVSIYVSSNIQFYPIDLKNFNKERDLEICALKIDLSPSYLIMVCIYRSPNGDFEYFINQLEAILNNIYIKEE